MQTNDQLSAEIERHLAELRYPKDPARLYAPIGYSLSLPAKRLRPMLLMIACGIFTDRTRDAIPAAIAIEIYHNFTLLHDDIMDNAAMRRGNPSVFAKWGQNVAILSGDAMLIGAYQELSALPGEILKKVLPRFNTMAIEVCEGQQYDMDFETQEQVSVDEYLHMISLKTSALLAGAVVIGAMIGGAGEEDCRLLDRFAVELGQAFQLQDDLLDSYGDERLGKAIGGDILEGKKTYLMIAALDRASQEDLQRLQAAYKLPDAEKIARVKEIYDRLEVPQITRQQIEFRYKRAINLLDNLSVQSAGTERLREFAKNLIGRNR